MRFLKKELEGLTLAELLVALAILGVIATFTIPKILANNQNQEWNAAAHEFAGTVANNFLQYRQDGFPNNAAIPVGRYSPLGMTPYMNYMSVDTSGTIDDINNSGTQACNTGTPCYLLHNGAKVRPWNCQIMINGASSTNALGWSFDPDGKVTDGTTNGPGKAVRFLIFYNGKLSTIGAYPPGTYSAWTLNQCSFTAMGTEDPDWFKW